MYAFAVHDYYYHGKRPQQTFTIKLVPFLSVDRRVTYQAIILYDLSAFNRLIAIL